MRKYLIVLLLSLPIIGTWYACSPTTTSASTYFQWIEDPANGMCVATTVAAYQFELQYMPPAALVMLDEGPEAPQQPEWEDWLAALSKTDHFRFRIRPTAEQVKALRVANQPNEMGTTHFTFEAQRDFWMQSGQDSIPCRLYHHESNHGISQDLIFVMSFPKLDRDLPLQFHYNDQVLGTGKLNMTLDPQSWSESPDIN